jgi:outer membrane protein assembly factor BamB
MNVAAPPCNLLQRHSLLRLLLSLTLVGWPAALPGADWPQYRGPNHDGISTDRIIKDWTGSVTNPVWRLSLTNCLGSFAVSGGRAFTQARRATNGVDKEFCVALSAEDGRQLWATPLDDALYPHGGVGFDDGPRTTPAVSEGSVFVLSTYLKLYRLNATNGAVQWQQDLLNVYAGSLILYQNAASPLLEGDRIFVNASCWRQSLMALRTSDGGLLWRSEDAGMTHSTPVLATIHGVRQVIFVTQGGLIALDPQSGARLWTFPYPFTYSTSIGASPVVYEDMVLVTGAQLYDMGTVVARIERSDNTWRATQLWSKHHLRLNPGQCVDDARVLSGLSLWPVREPAVRQRQRAA